MEAVKTMKNQKKHRLEELALEPVTMGAPGRDFLKSMSLDELLASLALILEFEAVGKEVYCPENSGSPSKFLH